MCLILFAYHVHPDYRLILAANRDEFYDRPSAPADFWSRHPQVLAGMDLKEKGTWLGVTKEGKFAAITNYRDPASWKADAPSRGKLVSRYLTGSAGPEKYLRRMVGRADAYNGFNLLLGDGADLFVYSNRGDVHRLSSGIYGLSNELLDTPWPKVRRGKRLLEKALAKRGKELEEALFDLLSDRAVPPDGSLPDTGIGLEWERLLAPMFIKSPVYGTRSSTLLLIGKNKRIKLIEKTYNGEEEPWLVSRFAFPAEDRTGKEVAS
ncbi:MAG TPA: NRDE family protein [Smithellaceae bacterium]|nr:NRDE family protein [Smithellaceae bacterium]HRS81925.1 NRDE family protein [Smithellaceae bacterium]HRV44135.1 NRDE family protein [Smithellaceae bacterium]